MNTRTQHFVPSTFRGEPHAAKGVLVPLERLPIYQNGCVA
jgi:hypothetical protein